MNKIRNFFEDRLEYKFLELPINPSVIDVLTYNLHARQLYKEGYRFTGKNDLSPNLDLFVKVTPWYKKVFTLK